LYRGCNDWVGIYPPTQRLGTGFTTLADYRVYFKPKKIPVGYTLCTILTRTGKGTSLIVSGEMPGALIGVCPNRQLHFEEVHALGIERCHERIVGPT
jgi:hypothetical protein